MTKDTQSACFIDMARIAGLPKKGMYSVREVSRATGVPFATLSEEVSAGRITSFLPPGRVRGRLIKPEWVDQWMEQGTKRLVEW